MLLFNRYEYNPQTDLLGKGGFSRVYKAVDKKFNRLLALKIYKTSELSDRYSPIAEIQRVIDLDHPNISRYIDIDEIEKEDAFGDIEKIQVCVMELLDGGNIAKFYQANKDLSVLKKLLVDVLQGLSYLHRNGIIHRDIKPANILIKRTIDGPIAKITDFGISKKSDSNFNSTSSALIVSIPYMAPEQLNLQRYGIDERVSYNIDFWSLGVAVYETISGEVLFKNSDHDSSEQIMTNIMSPELPEKINDLPQPFKAFVSACIIKDAKQRIQNADALIAILHADYTEPHKTKDDQNQEPGFGDLVNRNESINDISEKHPKIESSSDDQSPNEKLIAVESEGVNEKNIHSGELAVSDRIADDDRRDTAQFSNVSDIGLVQNNRSEVAENLPEAVQRPDIENQDSETSTYKENKVEETATDDHKTNEPEKSIMQQAEEDDPDETKIFSRLVPSEGDENPDDTRVLISSVRAQDLIPKEEEAASDDTRLLSTPFADQTITGKSSDKNADDTKIPADTDVGNDSADITKIIIGSVKGKKPSAIFQHKEGPITLFNRYTYLPSINLIGKGGFSRVYKAYDNKLGRFVALKIYKTGEFSDNYSPIAEIRRVVNLDHPNICRYLDIEEIEKENPFGENEKIQVCVMELLDSGNFAEYYKANQNPAILKKLLQDILNGLAYLHKKGIVHRDIKPANILIKEGVEGPIAKITDFGISKITDTVNNNSSSALVVSIPYMAPEQLNPRKYGIEEKISFNLDLWSLGVTIYEVITGNALFKNSEQESSEQIMANIMSPGLPDKINELQEPFRNIVSHCVVKNARERSRKAEDLLELLNARYEAPKVTEKPEETAVPVIAVMQPSAEQEQIRPAPPQIPKKPVEPISQISEPELNKEKRKFSTIDFSSKETEIKARKSISFLKISVAAAALILLVILAFFIKSSLTEKADINNLHGNDTTENKSKATVITSPKSPDTISGHTKEIVLPKIDSVIKSNAESHADIRKKKNADVKNTNTVSRPPIANSSNAQKSKKCTLELTTEQTCTIKIDSRNYGELEVGKTMKIYLFPGKYTLEAVNADNKSSPYFGKEINIKPEHVDKTFYYKISF
ncbi:MAG TPA: protein kinase [Puia sp.]|jgi:serine/threonine protein kinase|nr:protein kinase [Puia sp.]